MKTAKLAFFCLTVLLFICPSILMGFQNDMEEGVHVRTRSLDGSSKMIRLYSGYHALVVGCSNYRQGWPMLPNAVKDAREVAAVFKDMGWAVDLLEDPTWSVFRHKLNELVTGPGQQKDKGILFWYSGHGFTLKEADETPLGYLIPVDAPDPYKDMLGFMNQAISMRNIETVSKQITSKHVLMVFDSCFSGAIFQLARDKPSPYIQEKVQFPVRQFITAGTEDEAVPDKSIFKEVFIQGIKSGFADLNQDQYITGEELGAYLQEQVINYSRKTQHPQFGKINNPKLDKGDFVFIKGKVNELEQLKAAVERLMEENERLKNEIEGLKSQPIVTSDYKTAIGEQKKEDAKFASQKEKSQDHSNGKRGQDFKNSFGMKFVNIPPGNFLMGSPPSERGRRKDEKRYRVTLTKGFYMQTTEVTQGQWKAVRGKNPSRYDECGDTCPVEKVSWSKVQEFIRELNALEGTDKYRLPTEAEWEYASRAGSETRFTYGDDSDRPNEYLDLKNYAWYYKNSKSRPHPVAQKKPNAWGLYDMHGNVYEWCRDGYGRYPDEDVSDPKGNKEQLNKVYRGGSWRSFGRSCRSSHRERKRLESYGDHIGFRLVKEP